MAFRDDLISDIDDIFYNNDDFAEKIPYTPVGGTVREIMIIKSYNEDLSSFPAGQAAYVSLKAKSSEVTPKNRDTFVLDGMIWTVEKVETANDGLDYNILARTKSRARVVK